LLVNFITDLLEVIFHLLQVVKDLVVAVICVLLGEALGVVDREPFDVVDVDLVDDETLDTVVVFFLDGVEDPVHKEQVVPEVVLDLDVV